MSNKITWKMIFEDFKLHHPKLADRIIHWRPDNYLTIIVYTEDGLEIKYEYWVHRSTVLRCDLTNGRVS